MSPKLISKSTETNCLQKNQQTRTLLSLEEYSVKMINNHSVEISRIASYDNEVKLFATKSLGKQKIFVP